MDAMLCRDCISPDIRARTILSHSPLPGQDAPEPCTAPGCTFAHDRSTASAEYVALVAEEARLIADDSKPGKARYARWRLAHAKSHGNVAPLSYGSSNSNHYLIHRRT